MRLYPLAAMLALAPLLHAATEPATITEAELVRRSQQLYDAVAKGDQAPWAQYYADDAIYFDEKGRSMDKKALLEDLSPFPAGYSGEIKIMAHKALMSGNTAILSYDQAETETVYGQELHARYHTTDTWLYRNGRWQIAASQTLRYYEDPAAAATNAKLLNDYLGTYQIAPGQTVVITRDGDTLMGQRSGAAKPTKLLQESTDIFFRTGVEGRRLFHRDANGKVDSLIDRRNNEDLVWKKIS